MSIVVGMVTAKGTYIAADSQVTSDDGHKEYEALKVFSGEGYLLGVAGDYKVVNLMEHFSFKWPKGKDKKKFLITSLPLIIKEYLEPYAINSGEDSKDEYSILIAYDRGLCEITDTFEASWLPLFHAIGSGAPYSFGAYHALSFEFDYEPEDALNIIVGSANRYSAFCGGGVDILRLPD